MPLFYVFIVTDINYKQLNFCLITDTARWKLSQNELFSALSDIVQAIR
ncbi:hypothetical protein BN439_0862 [Erwinia amylovora Ea644]|nr:hypothetical protein BN439_0862 [Erwinia amylovora Ea644]